MGAGRVLIRIGLLALLLLTPIAGCSPSGIPDEDAPIHLQVYLVDDAQPGDVDSFRADLAGDRRVQDVRYVSKEEAYREIAESVEQEEQRSDESLSSEVAHAYLDVTVPSVQDADAVSGLIEQHPLFSKIVIGSDTPGGWIKYK